MIDKIKSWALAILTPLFLILLFLKRDKQNEYSAKDAGFSVGLEGVKNDQENIDKQASDAVSDYERARDEYIRGTGAGVPNAYRRGGQGDSGSETAD